MAVPSRKRTLFLCVKGGAQMHCVNASIVAAFTQHFWKFRDITFQTQRRDRNTQRNNVRFLLGTATCSTLCSIIATCTCHCCGYVLYVQGQK